MSGLLARDVAWFAGGTLFAWLTRALAHGARLLPLSARARGRAFVAAPARERPRCTRVPQTSPRASLAPWFALLLTVPPGGLAACGAWGAGAPAAVSAIEAGALLGMWFSRRRDLASRLRAIAWLGVAAGALASGGSVARLVLLPAQTAPVRAALYLAATLGAWLAGAAASTLSGLGAVQPGPPRRAPLTAGDRALHAAALMLGCALGCGFVIESRSMEFGVSVLVAASLLAAALGARLMAGARVPDARLSTRSSSAGLSRAQPQSRAPRDRVSFAGVPDELLVAACGSGSFAPECLRAYCASPDAPGRAAHHASQAVPLRRRSGRRRHAAPATAARQRQGPPG